MSLKSEFIPLDVEGIHTLAVERKAQGWRYVQMLAVNTEAGIDLVYSYMKDGVLENYEVKGIGKETTIPSVTDQFLAAFVFENEAHDLFGVDISSIAIDFGGNFYALSQKEPMTIISPAQKAAREKAAKLAAAKAARAKAASAKGAAAKPDDGAMEAKLAGMDPEKAAKVRAAMEAKAKKAAATRQAEITEKTKDLDPEKAAKVKAALAAKAAREKAKREQGTAGKEGE